MWLAYRWVEPAPPDRVVLAAGPEGGAYAAAANAYRETFGQNGVALEILHTGGSVENYGLLLSGEADLAIVQGGTLPAAEGERAGAEAELRSIASLYLEPLLIFHRADLGELDDLAPLAGKQVAVGPEGSGTRRLATAVLEEFELAGSVEAVDLPLAEATAELAAGRIDAMFAVVAPDAPLLDPLYDSDDVRLLPLRRAAALARRMPFLESVSLPEGGIDLAANRPPTNVPLVAPAAVLATRDDTHSAAVLLAAMAVQREHRGGTLLSSPGSFPSSRYTELPVSETADHYFKNGPSFLRRALPFWAASFAERGIIVLVPLLTLLVPLIRLAPPVYRWQVRSRIYKWYRELRTIDETLASDASTEAAKAQIERLASLEREARDVNVPLSYMEEFYNLRLHVQFLRRRAERRAAGEDDYASL